MGLAQAEAARLTACAARVRRAAPAGGGVAGATSRNQAHFVRASATHTAPRWRRPTAASERRHGRGTADPAPVRLALRTPVCPCCVRGVLVRFVVGVCACSGPCLLHVPVLCVLGLCAFVLVVWCACIAFVYLVRPSPVNVTVLCVLGLCARPCCVCSGCARSHGAM